MSEDMSGAVVVDLSPDRWFGLQSGGTRVGPMGGRGKIEPAAYDVAGPPSPARALGEEAPCFHATRVFRGRPSPRVSRRQLSIAEGQTTEPHEAPPLSVV
jgi:hypothetical protein